MAAARELFATVGFQATLTEEIVRQAGLTRGALYHHFRDKEDLFLAVFEEVAAEVEQSLVHRSSGPTPTNAWELFQANSEVHLEAATQNAAYRQIVLTDGPAVLGWETWSARRGGPLGKIAQYLEEAVSDGTLQPLPAEAMSHLLGAIGTGAVMYVAQAEDPVRARRDIEACNELLLRGMVTAVNPPSVPAPHRSAAKPTPKQRQTTRQGGH
jgi:AcrR family transcriptional regulator